jgi:hypothetical protein
VTQQARGDVLLFLPQHPLELLEWGDLLEARRLRQRGRKTALHRRTLATSARSAKALFLIAAPPAEVRAGSALARSGRSIREVEFFPVCQMGTELILKHESVEQLLHDFEVNLRKGRAFIAGGGAGLAEREYCTLQIEHPRGGAPLSLPAEAVWIDPSPSGGVGLSFVGFDAAALAALQAFVSDGRGLESPDIGATTADPAPGDVDDGSADAPESEGAVSSESMSGLVGRNIHERVRALDLTERDVLARSGSLPERVALERRYGSSVWEALLHNPQITPREVLRMAKSTSLPTHLVNLIVNNRAWASDAAVGQALLANPRVSGPQLERLLRGLPQAELSRLAESSSLRMQVRQAAKRLIRR